MSLKLTDNAKERFDNITNNSFMELELSKIYPNTLQPRKLFDEEKLQELANSILKHGLLEPILVVKNGQKYMIIAGERRWRASQLANINTIKSIILSVDEKKVKELALIENIQRDDLTQFEIAKYVKMLWDSGDYEKKKDLAAAIGKKDTYISKVLSAFNLDDEILKDIEETKPNISISVLDEIARVGDKETQKLGYEKYKAGDITRDEIKHLKAPVEKDWSKDIWEADKESVEDVKTFTGETKKIKSKTTMKETCFNNLGLDFENYISDFKIGMILHPVGTEELKIKNLKSYKMYKIIIEEM